MKCPCRFNFHLGLDARCNSTTEGPSSPRPCYPNFFLKKSRLQDGIGELGIVFAHNHHCRNVAERRELWRLYGRMNSSLVTAITRTCGTFPWRFSFRDFAYLWPEPHFRILPNSRPTTGKKAMISKVGLFALMEETHSAVGALAGWGAVARSPHGRIYIMFAPRCYNQSTSRVCKKQNPLE